MTLTTPAGVQKSGAREWSSLHYSIKRLDAAAHGADVDDAVVTLRLVLHLESKSFLKGRMRSVAVHPGSRPRLPVMPSPRRRASKSHVVWHFALSQICDSRRKRVATVEALAARHHGSIVCH